MSLKNFMSYDDAATVLGEYADKVNELKSGLTNVDVALSVPNGSGKNVLPLTLANIKSMNISGTWSDNAYTISGLTFTVQINSDGNVSGISANGTVPSDVWGVLFYLPSLSVKDGESYTLTGCPNGGGSNTYVLYTTDDGDNNISDFGDGITYTTNFTGNAYVRIVIYRGTTVNNVVFYPMIRPATINDPTFAPYIPSVESRIEAVESGVARIVCTEIVYDDSASLFTLPAGVSKPKDGAQIMVCGRNRSTGAIYALWFDNSASGFKIGKILDGSAPADGTSISVQYIA